MKDDLRTFGFDPTKASVLPGEFFQEQILQRLTKAERPWTWLPEWQALHDDIIAFQS